eukprot:gene18118-23772_t
MAVVHEVHELSGLASIKFSRGQYGIIVLQFKSGKSLQYKVKDAGVFADYIKNAMINMGINGKVTKSKSALKNITSAEELLIKTKDLEAMFSVYPSFDLIQELVDVLRDAVERFDAANDERYMDAIKLVQLFLNRDDVIKILSSSGNVESQSVTNQVNSNIGKILISNKFDNANISCNVEEYNLNTFEISNNCMTFNQSAEEYSIKTKDLEEIKIEIQPAKPFSNIQSKNAISSVDENP